MKQLLIIAAAFALLALVLPKDPCELTLDEFVQLAQ